MSKSFREQVATRRSPVKTKTLYYKDRIVFWDESEYAYYDRQTESYLSDEEALRAILKQ